MTDMDNAAFFEEFLWTQTHSDEEEFLGFKRDEIGPRRVRDGGDVENSVKWQ